MVAVATPGGFFIGDLDADSGRDFRTKAAYALGYFELSDEEQDFFELRLSDFLLSLLISCFGFAVLRFVFFSLGVDHLAAIEPVQDSGTYFESANEVLLNFLL